jgi:hypothetical protein
MVVSVCGQALQARGIPLTLSIRINRGGEEAERNTPHGARTSEAHSSAEGRQPEARGDKETLG